MLFYAAALQTLNYDWDTLTSGAEMERATLVRRGFLLEVFTVTWNIFEGVIAIAAGVMAGSTALTGFGMDSLVETASGWVVGRRMYLEMKSRGKENIEELERGTARLAGALLLLLAGYLSIDGVRRLLGFGARAEESLIGIVLTVLSLAVMPILGRAKLRTAAQLGSGALRADAYETITCAWLPLTTLAGLLLNAAFGWWWADPAAALVLVPLIVKEGPEGWRGEHCGCH